MNNIHTYYDKNTAIIFGIKFWIDNLNTFTTKLVKRTLKHFPSTILPCTLNEIYLSQHNRSVLKKINSFTYVTTDGIPLFLLSKISKKFKSTSRIYGPDLMESVCNQGQKYAIKHFLLGSNKQTINKLTKKLKKKYPKIIISGAISPPFKEKISELPNKTILKQINAAQPNFLWVSLGGQKQIDWIYQYSSLLPHTTVIAIGAAFDFISGEKPQAPKPIRQIGLEWLFRLISEPKRLYRRYILQAPYLLAIYLAEILSQIKKMN